jgi:hypothetical protein
MSMSLDPSRLQIPSSGSPIREPQAGPPRLKKGDRFLKGPIPWDWLAAAAACPGKSLQIGIAVWLMAGLTRSHTVQLPRKVLDAMCVDRYAKRRAVSALEAAGLISAIRRRGVGPVITIREVVGPE